MSIEWHADNTMRITQTIDGSGSGATVTATILNRSGAVVGSPLSLTPTGETDEYGITVHPAGAYDLSAGQRYTLRIRGLYQESSFETLEEFIPRRRKPVVKGRR